MGYMCHHAILVTGWDEETIRQAHAEARRLLGEFESGGHTVNLVSEVLGPAINGYQSFFVAPDGSKEGWATSDQGDAAREEFLAWLRSQAYEDGSSRLDWALVQFGDDDGDQRVLEATSAVVGPQGNLINGQPGDRARR